MFIQLDSKKKKNSNLLAGFRMIDELMMRIISTVFSMRIDKLIIEKENEVRRKEIIGTLKLANEITC